MSKLRISISERERNFCEDDSHKVTENYTKVILLNGPGDEKPLDKVKLSELVSKLGKNMKVVELGGLKLDIETILVIANSGASVECIRIYDCTGITDEILKLIGQRFTKTLKHVELLGFPTTYTTNVIKSLITSIGNLEAIHIDSSISVLASMSGTITNLKQVWSKIFKGEKECLQEFTIKYAQYLRNLDITFSGTKSETPDYVAIIANLFNLFKLSVTATGDTPIDNQISLIGQKFGTNFKELNICVWSGSDNILEGISKFSNLEILSLNGRSPMSHIDFKLNGSLQMLSDCKKLKHFRLILKNHNPNLFDNIEQYLPHLEILEVVGLDIGDTALMSLAKLKNISFLDIVSPLLSDNGIIHLIENSPKLTWFRPNGGESINRDHKPIGPKTLDAFGSAARRQPNVQFEIVFSSITKINLDARIGSIPPNLTVKFADSPFLLSFPGNTPRGF